MIIYGILNKVNCKLYIGKSKHDDIQLKRSRPQMHLNGQGSKRVFDAVKCYSLENFLVLTLHKESCTEEELNKLEIYYIKLFNTIHPNGYNFTEGGEGAVGYVFTEDQRSNLSKSRKISHTTLEFKKKMSESHKGINNFINKTKEEMRLLGQKKSKSMLGKNKGRNLGNTASLLGAHVRWHVNRNLANLNCKFC